MSVCHKNNTFLVLSVGEWIVTMMMIAIKIRKCRFTLEIDSSPKQKNVIFLLEIKRLTLRPLYSLVLITSGLFLLLKENIASNSFSS